MKFLGAFVLVALFAVILADNPNANDEIVRFEQENTPKVGYKFGFETTGGIKHDEDAKIIDPNAEESGYAVKGSYSFVADDGQTYTVNYVADETGFHPEGAHLPRA